jgi:hypothetical protein
VTAHPRTLDRKGVTGTYLGAIEHVAVRLAKAGARVTGASSVHHAKAAKQAEVVKSWGSP